MKVLPFFTRDEAAVVSMDDMRILTDEKIGPKRSVTKEGFLLCEEVPIARTGVMLYAHGETPVPVGKDGFTRIQRLAEDVFKAEFVLSFAGKPVVNDHPFFPVTTDNWRDYVVGTVLNPRRGSGDFQDCIVADLLICDAQAIEEINSDKRQVSAGYKAHYDELAPGVGKQYDMHANHVALVKTGRCGTRCSIGDHRPAQLTGDSAMSIKSLLDAVREALKNKDEKKVNEALDAASTAALAVDQAPKRMTDEQINAAIQASEERVVGSIGGLKTALDGLSEKLNKAAPIVAADAAVTEAAAKLSASLRAEATKDAEKAAVATDSTYLADSFQETLSLAEILHPGIRVPTFDVKAAPGNTFDAICALRRNALELAYSTNEGRTVIDGVSGGKVLELAKLPCDEVRALFRSAGTVKKNANSIAARASDRSRSEDKSKALPVQVRSVADLNAKFREHYKMKSPTAQ